jgi:hypothetical protein
MRLPRVRLRVERLMAGTLAGGFLIGSVVGLVHWVGRARRPLHSPSRADVRLGMTTYKSQDWANGSGRLAGHAAHVRKNKSLASVRRSDYPVALLVNLVYTHRGPDGLPQDEDELSRLDRTEEAVADRFEAVCQALFALVVTGDGTRDLFLYLPKRDSEDEIARHLRWASPEVDYDFTLHEDPDWRPYQDLMP